MVAPLAYDPRCSPDDDERRAPMAEPIAPRYLTADDADLEDRKSVV